MYSNLFAQSIRKLNLVLFGEQTEILITNRIVRAPKITPCIYVAKENKVWYDPNVVAILNRLGPTRRGFYILFENVTTEMVNDAIFGRDHIKVGTVVWSVCIKAVWGKVRDEQRLLNPDLPIKDLMLTPEEIVDCLPSGFEFGYDLSDLTPLEVVEGIFNQEESGYATELGPNIEDLDISQEGGTMLEQLVEASVLSHIAVRCNGEARMLQFLKACSDASLEKCRPK